MIISNNNKIIKQNNQLYSFNFKSKNVKESSSNCSEDFITYLDSLAASFKSNVISDSTINLSKINSLDIPNKRIYKDSIVRGESLSSKKNRKFIRPIKNAGIKNVIDLRDKYSSNLYSDLCETNSLNYFHLPVDSHSVPDEVIIDNLPTLIKTLDKGSTFIACAQGLHRTDIALALYYFFNPKEQEIPKMFGHVRENGFKCDDILRRINSVNNKISDEMLVNLGWNLEDYEATFEKRRFDFIAYNRFFADEMNRS